MYYVYLHIAKDTSIPFYVGKGKGNRLNQSNSRSRFWGFVANKHDWYSDVIAEFATEEEALLCEQEAIAFFGRRDVGKGILVNMTDGGDGVAGRIPSNTTRKKWKESWTPERRASYSDKFSSSGNPRFGKNCSEATRLRMSEKASTRVRKPHSEATKVKIRGAQKGIKRPPLTAEHKAKISASNTGIKHTMTKKRAPMSEAQKLKISQTQKARWATRLGSN